MDKFDFLRLLVSAPKDQMRALLYTLNREQTNAIGEALMNIIDENPHYSKKFYPLGDPKLVWYKRRSLIRKHMTLVTKLFKAFRSFILDCCTEYSSSEEDGA